MKNDYHFSFLDGDEEGEITITAETYDKAYKILQSVIDGSFPPQRYVLKYVESEENYTDRYFCTKCKRWHIGGTKIFERHFIDQGTHL